MTRRYCVIQVPVLLRKGLEMPNYMCLHVYLMPLPPTPLSLPAYKEGALCTPEISPQNLSGIAWALAQLQFDPAHPALPGNGCPHRYCAYDSPALCLSGPCAAA